MAMPRRFIRRENWEFGGQPGPAEGESGEPKSKKRRLATTFIFTTLFFTGASLAALAGNQMSPLMGEDSQQIAADEATSTTTTGAETPPADDPSATAPEAPSSEAPAPDASASSADPGSATDESVDQLAADPTPPPNPDAASASSADAGSAAPAL